jgi:transposase
MPSARALTDHERVQLQVLAEDDNVHVFARQRALIVLLAEEGKSTSYIARQLKVSRPTISTWLARFDKDGLEGLADLRRSGRPPKLGAADIIRRTLQTPPAEVPYWSTRRVIHAAR